MTKGVRRDAARSRPLDSPTSNRIRVLVDVNRYTGPREQDEQFPEQVERRVGERRSLRSDQSGQPGRDLVRLSRFTQRDRHPARQLLPGLKRRAGMPETEVQRRAE